MRKPISCLVIFLVLVGLFITLSFYAFNYFQEPVNSQNPTKVMFTVKKGWTVHKIAAELYSKRLIKNAYFFVLYIKFFHPDIKLRYGTYSFTLQMNIEDIITKLKKGEIQKIPLKIIPGEMFKSVYRKIARLKFLKTTYSKVKSLVEAENVIVDAGILIVGLQYFIKPDTYFVSPSQKLADILKMITKERIAKVRKYLIACGSDKVKFLKAKERIVLASILEKEGRSLQEKKLIASVFLNRLKKKMKLESCATVQYILREQGIKRSRLTYADLKLPSLFNTYLHYGLPPDPICVVGEDSLQAAFFPEKTKYLYFVLQPDGKHHFSATLAEHNKYKKKLKRWLSAKKKSKSK
jgi:UPF0755 protein